MKIFKNYTTKQAAVTIGACRELLEKIDEKGDVPFNNSDTNVLKQSISTLRILISDTELK